MRIARTRNIAAVAFAGLLLLGACGGDDDSSDPAPEPTDEVTDGTETDSGNSDSGDDSSDDGDSGDSNSGDSDSGESDGASGALSLMLSVSRDGEEETYRANPTSLGCSRNPLGEGTFGVQYMADEQEGFHSLQMEIDDAEAAKTGNSTFSLTTYVDDERHHIQRGTDAMMTLEDKGDTAKIIVLAATEEGADISVTIDCHTVIDF